MQFSKNLKEYARDIKLNISSVLTEEGSPGLTLTQIWSITLASAYFTKNSSLASAILVECLPHLSPEHREAAKGATTIMAMNNVYYRFLHLSDDKEIGKMPANLRMNIIGKPGIEKVDFELMSLAVSALSGCGMCINAHIAEVKKAGISREGIQSAIKIAAVVNAAAQALSMEDL